MKINLHIGTVLCIADRAKAIEVFQKKQYDLNREEALNSKSRANPSKLGAKFNEMLGE